jgi:uncharacterized protein YcbK (DUF882 family)
MDARWLSLALFVVAAPTVAVAQNRSRAPISARDRVYVVRPGDSIRRIAALLEVPVRDFAALNNLRPPYLLSVGRRLRVPEDASQEVLRTLPTRDEVSSDADGSAHHAGRVTLVRARDAVEMTTNFTATGPALRARVERMMQSHAGQQHMIHPRLVRVFPTLSDRFGGRRITVLSGFRPHQGGRDEPRSRHALGYAVDLRVEDVPLRAVWEFCRTIPNVGCGLSTRGNFVHVDVRTESAAWMVGGRDEPTPAEDDLRAVAEDAHPTE